jgi:hypothetical protein
VRQIRRDIARMKTIAQEKRTQPEPAPKKRAQPKAAPKKRAPAKKK